MSPINLSNAKDWVAAVSYTETGQTQPISSSQQSPKRTKIWDHKKMIQDSQVIWQELWEVLVAFRNGKPPTHRRLSSAASQLPELRPVGQEWGKRKIWGYFALDVTGLAEALWAMLSFDSAGSGLLTRPWIPSPLIYGLCSQQIYTLCGFVFIVLLLPRAGSIPQT